MTNRMILCVLPLGVGCSDNSSSSNVNANDGGVAGDGGVVNDEDGGTVGGGDAGAMTLNDAQALDAMIEANQAEVTVATAAQPNLTSSDAKDFADMMISMHGAAAQKEQTLAQTLGITPEPSFATTLIMNIVQQNLQTLSTTPKGTAYDLAYICAQVQGHSTIIAFVDSFTSGVSNAQIAAEVQSVRATAVDHLAKAQAIAADLAEGPDAGAGCTAGIAR